MENSEKIIDPVLDSAENTNPNNTSDGFEIDLWDSSPMEGESHDLWDVFSEDAVADSNPIPEESPSNEVVASPENVESQAISSEQSVENALQEDSIEATQEETAPKLTEALNSVSEPEPVNNEVVLWKFDNEMISPIDTPNAPQSLDVALLNHPAVLEESPMAEVNAEEHQKAQAAQKAKLAQLIKNHESNAHKKWLMTWVLSGVVVTAWVLVLAWMFAKDQVIDVLNTINGEPTLSASVVDLKDNQVELDTGNVLDDEIVDDEDVLSDTEEFDDSEINDEMDENVDEYVDSEYVEDTSSDENVDSEYVEDTSSDENVDSEYVEDTSSDENVDEFDNSDFNDESTNEDLSMWYNITHVESEAEANWVMPAHCYDLTCYGADKEFTPCTTFRMAENLDENANRIGKNWVCKYKDPSELVYVEFN